MLFSSLDKVVIDYVIPCVLFRAPLVVVSLPLTEYLNSTSLGRVHAVLNEM